MYNPYYPGSSYVRMVASVYIVGYRLVWVLKCIWSRFEHDIEGFFYRQRYVRVIDLCEIYIGKRFEVKQPGVAFKPNDTVT